MYKAKKKVQLKLRACLILQGHGNNGDTMWRVYGCQQKCLELELCGRWMLCGGSVCQHTPAGFTMDVSYGRPSASGNRENMPRRKNEASSCQAETQWGLVGVQSTGQDWVEQRQLEKQTYAWQLLSDQRAVMGDSKTSSHWHRQTLLGAAEGKQGGRRHVWTGWGWHGQGRKQQVGPEVLGSMGNELTHASERDM